MYYISEPLDKIRSYTHSDVSTRATETKVEFMTTTTSPSFQGLMHFNGFRHHCPTSLSIIHHSQGIPVGVSPGSVFGASRNHLTVVMAVLCTGEGGDDTAAPNRPDISRSRWKDEDAKFEDIIDEACGCESIEGRST